MNRGKRERINIYLDEVEAAIARELAAASGLSISSWIRSLIMREGHAAQSVPQKQSADATN